MDAPNNVKIIKIKCKNSMENDESDTEYVCDMCPGVYKTEKKLRQHKARIHSSKKFICPTCGHELVGRTNYNNHIRKHEEKGQCTLCQKEIHKCNLTRHIKRCKGPSVPKPRKKQKKKFFCNRCDFGATTQKKLDRHTKTHDKKVHEYEHCDFTTFKTSNLHVHDKNCVEKKRKIPPSVVTNKSLEELFSDCHVSITDFNQITKFFKESIGSQFFEIGSSKVITEYCKSMNHLSKSETVEFEDTNGNKINRTLAYISDMKGLISEVVAGRGLSAPRMAIGSDYGQSKLIVTCSFYDDENPNEKCNGKLPSAPQSSFLLASADLVPETPKNMQQIFKLLGFPLKDVPNLR